MKKLILAILMGMILMIALAFLFAKVAVSPIVAVVCYAVAGGLIAFVSSRYFCNPKTQVTRRGL